MKTFTCVARYLLVFCLLLFYSFTSNAQRIYASNQDSGAGGLLCLNCTVTNPANAADGNVETYSTLNVTVGLAASTYQELIFGGTTVAANIPVTVKLGTGNNLLSATALGGITLQAYNGSTAVGLPVAASSLVSVVANNNQIEVSITPAAAYDRIRVTLNGGVLGALSSLYLYEGFHNGTGSGACNAPVDELYGISSGLLNLGAAVGGVVNPQNADDDNLTTYSTLNAGVGLVGAYAQQTIIYEAPSVVGDSIRLTMSIPQSLLSAGVLSNVTVSTFNGTSGTAETYSLNSSLLNVQLLGLLGGYQNVTVTYAPVNVFDRVQVTLGGGVANVLSTLNLYEAQKLIPRPIIKFNNVVTNSAAVCNGSSATLTAVAQANTTFFWYTAATGGSPIFTGSSYTTPALVANTTYYVAAMRAGCTDQSDRSTVAVTVNTIPANVVVSNTAVTVCPGQPATFTAQAVSGVTVNWYTAVTGGTPIATGNNFTTAALTATTSYYAEAVSGGTCVSPARTLVTATVSTLPDAPTITTPNLTICPNNVAVFSIANPVVGVAYNWYSTATGGAPLYTGINFTTPVLAATKIYYVEAENVTGCPSTTRAQATVAVNPAPVDPMLAANNQSISAGQTATVNVTNAQTGISYNWYTSTTASSSIYTGNTFTTPQLYTNTTYYVAAVNTAGCQSSDRTAITITVTINTNTPCAFANNESSSINNICIGCSITNNALAVDADTTTASTISVLAGLAGGSVSQQLIFQQPGYAGDTIKLELGTTASLLNAGVAANVQVALYNGATLVTSYPLTSSLLTVNLLPGGGNRYAVYIPATSAYDRIQVTLNSGVAGLINSLNVYYAVQEYPKLVFVSASPEICMGSTATINITSPNNGTFQFYTAPAAGTLAGTGSTFTTPALNANTTYYVAYTRGTCTSTVRYPIQILVDSPPAAPVVTPSPASIYAGQTATFTSSVANNVTVNWYSAATGGTPIYTGTTFTTPALTANTTYYAESSSGSCVSTTRTPANVQVTPIVVPDVTVTPATQTVNPGTTATLTASSTTSGVVFDWYTTPTGGSSIYTGATFTTPSIFANTTYYAQATVTASGTVSATRAAGVVNVSSSTLNPTPCDAAVAETTDINGLVCLGCAITNETAAVDADRNTFSQLTVPVGLLNAYASQTLRFPTAGIAGDSVIVELGVPGSLANVGVLSGISLATYNGTTYNNDRFSINTGTLTVALLNGATRFRYAFVATAPFDRVEIRLNSTASVLNALNIYDAYEEVPAPVVTTSTVSVCQGTQATLTAMAAADETIRWYSTATGGTPLFTGTTFNTPALTASTVYYAEASRTADGCLQAIRTPATVTVIPLPSAPTVAAPTQTICSGSTASFTAATVGGISYNWYTSATGGAPVFTGNTFTTPALIASTNYYVEADNTGSCTSTSRTVVTANVITTPTTPTVTPTPIQICAGSMAILTAASAQAGVNFNWYTNATGGTPIYTGAQFTTPALTANTSYFVEAATGTCISATRAEADIIVNPTPVNPIVTVNPAGGQVTSGQTASLAATSATAGVTFNWYTTATGGTPIFTGATYVTPALFSTTTYYVEAANTTTGCVSAQRTAATVIVNPVFSTSCDFASSQTNSNSGVLCVGCGVTNPNNAVDADTTTYSQLALPVALLGAYEAQNLIFSDPGQAGDTVTIRMRIPAALLNASVLGNIQITSYNGGVANNDAVTLNANTVKVQVLSGNKDVLVKFVPNAAFNAVQVSLVDNVLSALGTLDIFYASKQVSPPTLVASTVNICSGNTATFTVSNPQADVTYTWYNSGGALVYTGTRFTTGVLSATTTYYVQSSRTATGCVNPNKVAATANVTPSPVPPVLAQNNLQICAGNTTTLSVTNGTGLTVNWYDAATSGNLLFTGANYTVSPIVTTSYYVEMTNGTCTSPSRRMATVTVNLLPLQPGVQSNNITVCSGSTATINVTSPETGVIYNYYAAEAGGAILGSGTSFTTSAITSNTTYYVEAANATTGCINTGGRTAVNISITNPVTAPTLSATSTQVCSGGGVSISVTNPVAGLTYNWYDAPTGGTLLFTGTTFNQNNITAIEKYYVEAANSSGCISPSRTETDINVTPIPPPPTVQTSTGSTSVCAGSSTTIWIVNPQSNTVYNWYDAATGGTLLFTGIEYQTPALTSSATYYVDATTAGNCNPSSRTAVTITVNALPADPVLVSNTVLVCPGNAATFSISSPQPGVSYNWYDSAAETNLLFTGTTYITGLINTTTNFYVSAANTSGCASTNLAIAQAVVSPLPMLPALTNPNPIITCSGTQVTLNIANPQAGYTYNFYTSATGGASVFTGTSFTTPVLTAGITYYADATSSGGCTSGSRSAFTINVSTSPTAPVASVTGTAICSGNTTTITAASADPSVTINWYSSAVGGTILSTGNSFTTPVLTTTTTYYAEAVNSDGCASPARTSVTVTVSPVPDAPIAGTTGTTICAGNATTLTAADTDPNATLTWYANSAGGMALATGNSFTTPELTAGTTYYIAATNVNGCSSTARTAVTITVSSLSPSPVAGTGGTTVCSGNSTTLTATDADPAATINWYAAATGGAALATGGSFSTPVLTASTTYYVDAISTNGCPSAVRTAVNVTVSPTPVAPAVGATGTSICAGNITTITATSTDPTVSITWFAAATGGTALATGKSFTTQVLTANTTYYAEADAAAGCASTTRTAVNITVSPLPLPPVAGTAGTSICADNATTLTATDADPNLIITWYANAAGGIPLATGNSFTTPVLSTNTTYYIDATNVNGCNTGARTAVTVTVSPLPASPIAGTGGTTVCSGNATTLTATDADATATINWYASATGGTALATGGSFATPVLTANTTYYAEADNNSGCASLTRTAVNITISPIPDEPVAGPGGTAVCSGNATTLTATDTDPNATITWYADATGGAALTTGNSFTTPVLTANTTYYISATNAGGCTSSARTAVTITVSPLPAPPIVGAGGTTVCAGNATTLTATSNSPSATITWYAAATGGTALATGGSYTTPILTTNTTYYVDAMNVSGCSAAARTAVNVIVSPVPAAPTAGTSGTSICAGNATIISATTADPNISISWYANAAGGIALATGNSFTTPALIANTTYYAEADNTAGCSSTTRVAVNITVSPIPAAPAVTNPSSIQACAGTHVILNIDNPQAGYTYNWYTIASGGTAVFTGNSFLTPALNAGITYYAEADNSGSCPSATRTAVSITVSPIPDAPQASAQGTSICPNTSTVITATSNDPTTTITWYAGSTGGVALATGNSFNTPVLTNTTTYYAEAENTNSCTSANRTAVTVTVNPLPSDPIPASSNVAVCTGGDATLMVSSPQSGVTYNWYGSATSTTVLFTGATYVTGPITSSATYYVSAVNSSGCTSNKRGPVQVIIQAAPNAPATLNQGTVQTCAGTSVTLGIANPQSRYTYNWYNTAIGGSSVYTGTEFTTPVLNAGTTYYADAANSAGCSSDSRTAVNISVTNAPNAPQVIDDNASVCPGSTVTLTATSNDPNATIKWYSSTSGGALLASGSNFTTPVLTVNTIYYAEADNTASGCISATRTPAIVTILQPLASPVVSVSETTPSSVTFTWGAVIGAVSYQVSMDNGVTFVDPASGSLSYTTPGLNPGQNATLIVRALGNSGCQLSANSDAVTGTAQNPIGDEIFVPNAFTPNGDGKNDIEYVYGTSIRSLTFYVYNQWGEMIFKSNVQSSGWDGTYKGTNQPVGVYVYYVEAIMNDGKHQMKKGTITLLR